ncbi:DNA mismatch repair protein MutS [Clostridia bacterium]|nr:DNA mismatch repair protein MutS [Clostridia bacterium]
MAKMTPMLSQYLEIKADYPDAILFYRVGDFYEMFFEDAVEASAILEITLTKKNLGTENPPAPLCGVPYHAAETYLARLLAAGRKVAICDQTEDPAAAKGIVRREVTRVVTPGTMTSELMLDAGRSNFLVSVFVGGDTFGLAYTDISTGELSAVRFSADSLAAAERALFAALARIEPSEIILGGLAAGAENPLAGVLRTKFERETRAYVTVRPYEEYLPDGSAGSASAPEDAALMGLFAYLKALKVPGADRGTQDRGTGLLSCQDKTEGLSLCPAALCPSGRMRLDRDAIRNLELTETMHERTVKGSLLWALDRTRTAMGARMLKNWVKEPLIDKNAIDARLNAVEYLLDAVFVRSDLMETLKAIYDVERIAARASAGTANGRDLQALRMSLERVPEIADALTGLDVPLLAELSAELGDFSELRTQLAAALLEEQPVSTQEGRMIREGYSPDLDELKYGIRDGRAYIAELEGKERERTGIKNLKVRYNRVQGYYIEITNANLGAVPENYTRKQTLVNAERFVTPELKRMEYAVLSAEEKINALEWEILTDLTAQVTHCLPEIRRTAGAIARVDCLCSLARIAQEHGYVRPEITEGGRILIVRGRHPVIERTIFASGGTFVPNDAGMDTNTESLLLITGPNMAGKSTFMRQTALIVLLAQMGSFVPAERAEIGICDRIFTRIGASDNIAHEQSTFLVEMSELSNIIAEYTERSLIILDEIGRGTSTYDGLAIAWAVLDYLCAEGRRVRCMFATHYHELTVLEGYLKGLVNLSTQIDDTGNDVVYLHRVAAGASSRSYGIHVAKMAGLPQSLLADAQSKLDALESDAKEIRIADPASEQRQLSFLGLPDTKQGDGGSEFDTELGHRLAAEIKGVNVFELTPSAAISLIEKLKGMLER